MMQLSIGFRNSNFPHKSVDLSFILVMIQDKLTDLCGNRLLQDDFIKNICEVKVRRVSGVGGLCAEWIEYRGSSLVRNSVPPGPNSRTMPRALWWL